MKSENKPAAQHGRRVIVSLLVALLFWLMAFGKSLKLSRLLLGLTFLTVAWPSKILRKKNPENGKVWCTCSSLKLSIVVMVLYIIYVYLYYVYIQIISVWGGVHLWMTRGDVGVLTYHTLSHSLEPGYLIKPRSKLTVSKLQWSSCLYQPPPAPVLGL